MQTVNFLEHQCIIQEGEYSNGRVALQLVDFESCELIADVTVNLPDESIPGDHVVFSDYPENKGLIDILIEFGIFLPFPSFEVYSGYMKFPVYMVLPSAYEEGKIFKSKN